METAKKEELDTLRSTLLENGYPLHIIGRAIKEGEVFIKRMTQTEKNNNASNEKKTNKNLVYSLPCTDWDKVYIRET